MLNIAKIDVGHANYYAPRNGEGRESASLYGSGGSGGGSVDGAARYYADGAEGKGVWVAGGGMSVEVGAVVDNAQLTAMLAGYDPTTGVRLGRKYQAGGTFVDRMGITRQRKSVCAYDSTFSVPKSVSGAWALADDETRCEIEQAFDAAVTAVIDYLQLNAISSRRSGANGLEEVSCSRGATVARFTHTTSRAGDPQLHAHVLWANKVLCDDGKWRTLDGSKLYANAKAASMVGAAVLRGEISQRLGWSWDKSNDSGHCEIAGFPTVLAELWSQRRRAVERVAAKKVRAFESNRGREPTVEERIMIWQQAAEQTRAKKNELPSGDLFEQWKQQANSIGIDPTSVISSLRAADRAVPGVYDAPEQLIDTPLSDTGSSHVIATVEQYATGLTRQQLDEVIYRTISATGQARRVANSGVAAVHQRAELLLEQVRSAFVEVEGRWWSPGMMAAEASVFDWFDLRHSTPLADVAVDVDGLSDSQTAAVRLLAESTSNGSILIGPAGTGKTVALRPLCEAVGLEKVVAAAPTAVAAGSLGSSLRIRGETVAKLITSAAELPANGLVIVDEAGQLSTRDMAVLIGKADRVGARVLLVGDPAQQSSVAAGGLFDGLAHSQTGTIAALTELKRFIDPAEAAVTVQLRNGEIKALNFYADAGRSADCAAAEVAETAADWWFEHHDKSSVIAAPTRNITHEINIEIAARRAANGETGEPVAGAGESIMRLGDVITSRCNNRKIVSSNGEFVRNGDRWIIKGATKTGGLVAHKENSATTIVLPADYVADNVELGYAITCTRAQSLTVDAGLCVVTANSNLAQLYVGLTRGREENWLLTITDTPSFDPDTPPEHQPAQTILENIFERRLGWQTSIDPRYPPKLPPQNVAKWFSETIDITPEVPLPAMRELDVANVIVCRGDYQDSLNLADSFEALLDQEIDNWLASEHHIEVVVDETTGEWHAVDESLETSDFFHYEDNEARTDTTVTTGTENGDDEYEQAVIAREERRQPVYDVIAAGYGDKWWLAALDIKNNLAKLMLTRAGKGETVNPVLVELAARDDIPTGLLAAVADPPVAEAIRSIYPNCDQHVTPADASWARQTRQVVLSQRACLVAEHLQQHRDMVDAIIKPVREHSNPAYQAAAMQALNAYDEAIHIWFENGAAAGQLGGLHQQIIADMADAAIDGTAPSPICRPPRSKPVWKQLAEKKLVAPPVHWLECVNAQQPNINTNNMIAAKPSPSSTAADYYHEQLMQATTVDAQKARSYLHQRGVSLEEIQKWKLGWASSTANINDVISSEQALKTGLTRNNNCDHLRYRITFPITDAQQNTIGIAGRTLSHNPKTPKYLNTANTDTYNKSEVLYGLDQAAATIQQTGKAVIVEGYLDVIAAHRAGITNAVAACGTAVTDQHIQTLKNLGCTNTITFIFDGDTTGQQAAQQAVLLATKNGVTANTVTLPAGQDPASIPTVDFAELAAKPIPGIINQIANKISNTPDINPTHPTQLTNIHKQMLTAAANCPTTQRIIAEHETSTPLGLPIELNSILKTIPTPQTTPTQNPEPSHTMRRFNTQHPATNITPNNTPSNPQQLQQNNKPPRKPNTDIGL